MICDRKGWSYAKVGTATIGGQGRAISAFDLECF